jgi:hypothetical protein
VTPDRPAPGRSEDLATAVADLAWTWARRELGLASDEPPFSQWETLPPDRARQVQLALLGALEQMRAAVDDRARTAAYEAAAAGADYGDLGEAVGMTRQGARRRWPDLAEISKAARRT